MQKKLLRTACIALIAICAAGPASAQARKLDRVAEMAAIPSAEFPYAGFWKAHDCTANYGLAIAPAGWPGLYSVSFCGPGGCFKPGTYRPHTTLVNDDKYWVIDANTIEVGGCGKNAGNFARYVRCPAREVL